MREATERQFHLQYWTAKGSVYGVYPDGSTVRFKSYHPEHGIKDQGLKPRSEITVYVTMDQANHWSLMQASHPDGVSMALKPVERGFWGIQYTAGPGKGRWAKGTIFQPKLKPRRGLLPVELWKFGSVVHFGNTITKIEADPQYAEYFKKWLTENKYRYE